MSDGRTGARKSARISLTLTATALLVTVSAGSAAAKPRALDPCALALAQTASWPGHTSDGVRLVSDAYVSHLNAQPECTDPRS